MSAPIEMLVADLLMEAGHPPEKIVASEEVLWQRVSVCLFYGSHWVTGAIERQFDGNQAAAEKVAKGMLRTLGASVGSGGDGGPARRLASGDAGL